MIDIRIGNQDVHVLIKISYLFPFNSTCTCILLSLMVQRIHINCLNREVIINNLCSLSAWEKNWIMIYDSLNIHSEAVFMRLTLPINSAPWLCMLKTFDYVLYCTLLNWIICYISYVIFFLFIYNAFIILLICLLFLFKCSSY